MRLEPDELVRIKRFMELLAMHTAKRAPKTSATQRPQRPLLSKPRITRDQSFRLKSLLRRGRFVAVGVALGRAGQDLLGDQAGVLPDRGLDLGCDIRIGLQERL